MKKLPQSDRKKGSTVAIDETPISDPKGIAWEEEQRRILNEAAAQAKAFLAQHEVPEPEPVSSPKDAKQQAALEDRLARLADAINVAKVNLEAASKAEDLAKGQREKDQAILRAEQGRLEQEADAVQRDLEALEAIALADAVAAEQAVAPRPELADAATWRAMLAADMAPMVDQGVVTVVKLRELLAASGPILDKISGLQPDDTMSPPLYQRYAGIAAKARTLRAEIALAIDDTQRILNRAAKFEPQYYSEDVGHAAHLLQRDLQRVSGVVVKPRAFTDTRAGQKATGTPPAVPAVVAGYQQQVDDLLRSYRDVQTLTDAEKGQPNREVVIRLPADPALEQTRRAAMRNALRGPAPKVTPDRAGLRDLGIDPDAPPMVG